MSTGKPSMGVLTKQEEVRTPEQDSLDYLLKELLVSDNESFTEGIAEKIGKVILDEQTGDIKSDELGTLVGVLRAMERCMNSPKVSLAFKELMKKEEEKFWELLDKKRKTLEKGMPIIPKKIS